MPELPEVQTIVSELNEKIGRKKISAVEVFKFKSVRPMNKKFISGIVGKKIIGVTRRAKIIIIELSGGRYLLIHLKMTGQLVYWPKRGKATSGGHPIDFVGQLPNNFTRVEFDLSAGSKLFFNDIRRFGWIKLVNEKERAAELSKYGLEPLEKDFTLKNFQAVIAKYPKRKIKQILMDQSLIAGVGNIYADEACFAAKILPTRAAGALTGAEMKSLWQNIPKLLKFSISKKGTSADTYRTSSGEQGTMLKYLKVYGRGGQKCRRCGGLVKKIKMNGRGTHFCPDCQN